MEEIEFSRWLFEGRLRQGKNVLPDGLNWLCYFAGCSKSHCENSISFIILESTHQVDMKNVAKCWKDFLPYFTTLETYRVSVQVNKTVCDFRHALFPALNTYKCKPSDTFSYYVDECCLLHNQLLLGLGGFVIFKLIHCVFQSDQIGNFFTRFQNSNRAR